MRVTRARERQLTACPATCRLVPAAARCARRVDACLREADVQVGEHAAGGAVLVPDQPEQQVLGADVAVVERCASSSAPRERVARAAREGVQGPPAADVARRLARAAPRGGRSDACASHRRRDRRPRARRRRAPTSSSPSSRCSPGVTSSAPVARGVAERGLEHRDVPARRPRARRSGPSSRPASRSCTTPAVGGADRRDAEVGHLEHEPSRMCSARPGRPRRAARPSRSPAA